MTSRRVTEAQGVCVHVLESWQLYVSAICFPFGFYESVSVQNWFWTTTDVVSGRDASLFCSWLNCLNSNCVEHVSFLVFARKRTTLRFRLCCLDLCKKLPNLTSLGAVQLEGARLPAGSSFPVFSHSWLGFFQIFTEILWLFRAFSVGKVGHLLSVLCS